MNKLSLTRKEMVSMKRKNKVSCSTPEHGAESPSRDSDSMCDSDAGSPVPFLCTQDGAEGETDVVWNFYTPKTEHTAKSRLKNSTPLSRRTKRTIKPKIIEKQLPKRRAMRLPQRKTELFQELMELNQNLNEIMAKKPQSNCPEKVNSGSEDDVFSESPEYSPKSRLRSNSFCLRRNVLSSNFVKPELDAALESDDSMNECLIKASQVVEERCLVKVNQPEENTRTDSAAKRPRFESKFNNKNLKTDINFKMDQDSMDAILNSIKLDSPILSKVKKCDSPKLNNDSFDSLVGNLNDSDLDRLSQMPVKTNMVTRSKLNTSKKEGEDNNWFIKELVVHDGTSPLSKSFGRHSSMPESPSVDNVNKPSTSGMAFGRYNSMPFNNAEPETGLGDSPIRCTPEEIKKKHQLAREKLMAKRLLPFTSTQKTMQSSQAVNFTQQATAPKMVGENIKKQEAVTKKFQPRIPTATKVPNGFIENSQQKTSNNSSNIKSIIEKKRQEALMKLRRRQIQDKMI